MQIEEWDKEEIKRLAQVSGKPLEVQCAEAFLKAGWRVRLGTFYSDVSTEKIRELDVLAEKNDAFHNQTKNGERMEWRLCLRILGSCKGFPAEHCPVSYSVVVSNPTVEAPRFLCYAFGLYGRVYGGRVADSMRQITADRFLTRTKLYSGQQVVGFDIFHRKEDPQKKEKIEYVRKTDRDLYEGLDSAIKAAIFWHYEDIRRQKLRTGESNVGYITVNVPLLVLSRAFWDVSIDQGKPGEPVLKSSGFHVSLYPPVDNETSPEPIMSIIWDAAKLEELTRHLDLLFDDFTEETKDAVRKI